MTPHDTPEAVEAWRTPGALKSYAARRLAMRRAFSQLWKDGLMSKVAAALRALLDEVGEWQPIATAPDDGSYVLLWDRNVGLLQGWKERDGKWCHAWDGEYIPRPEALTHWRPEPKGPRA